MFTHTIMAPLTPIQAAPAIVLRVSGNIQPLLHFFSVNTPIPRKATFCRYKSVQNPDISDDVVLTYYQAPHSYTGEDVLEISFHGNPIILNTAVSDFASKDVRLAEPGEFTQRALLNGKLTPTQAEAINALIHARTAAGIHTAQNALHGSLDNLFQSIRQKLLEILAAIEAGIDFSEEIYELDSITDIYSIRNDMKELLAGYQSAQRVFYGVNAVIAGAPNAGKSTLFNLLLSKDRAIVSDEAGTTRDTLSEQTHINGVFYTLTDTAGIRAATSESETQGVVRAKNAVNTADLILILTDLSTPIPNDTIQLLQNTADKNRIIIGTKSDVQNIADIDVDIKISSKDISSIKKLKEKIAENVRRLLPEKTNSETAAIIAEHQRVDCEACLSELEQINADMPMDLQAYHIRKALDVLDRLQGHDVPEETLAKMFQAFCIGK